MKTDKQTSRSFHRTFFKLFLPGAFLLVMLSYLGMGETTTVSSNADSFPETTRTLAPRITTTTTTQITTNTLMVIDSDRRVWYVDENGYVKLLLSIVGE